MFSACANRHRPPGGSPMSHSSGSLTSRSGWASACTPSRSGRHRGRRAPSPADDPRQRAESSSDPRTCGPVEEQGDPMNSSWAVYKVVSQDLSPKVGARPPSAGSCAGASTAPSASARSCRRGTPRRSATCSSRQGSRGGPPTTVVGPSTRDEARATPPVPPTEVEIAVTFEEYAEQWYEVQRLTMEPKNRRGHRDNMRFATSVMRYVDNDHRLTSRGGRTAGGSSCWPTSSPTTSPAPSRCAPHEPAYRRSEPEADHGAFDQDCRLWAAAERASAATVRSSTSPSR